MIIARRRPRDFHVAVCQPLRPQIQHRRGRNRVLRRPLGDIGKRAEVQRFVIRPDGEIDRLFAVGNLNRGFLKRAGCFRLRRILRGSQTLPSRLRRLDFPIANVIASRRALEIVIAGGLPRECQRPHAALRFARSFEFKRGNFSRRHDVEPVQFHDIGQLRALFLILRAFREQPHREEELLILRQPSQFDFFLLAGIFRKQRVIRQIPDRIRLIPRLIGNARRGVPNVIYPIPLRQNAAGRGPRQRDILLIERQNLQIFHHVVRRINAHDIGNRGRIAARVNRLHADIIQAVVLKP